jgi:hypothetical protein
MRKLFSTAMLTEMAFDKNQTYLQVRWVQDWTHLGWLEVSRAHLASLGHYMKLINHLSLELMAAPA